MPELHEFNQEQKLKMESFLVTTLQKCKGLRIHAKRVFTIERVELVVYTVDLPGWKEVFAKEYSGITKKIGEPPTEDDLEITKTYGGVNEFQTLFVQNIELNLKAIAMFWPWNDNTHITVHMSFVDVSIKDTGDL